MDKFWYQSNVWNLLESLSEVETIRWLLHILIKNYSETKVVVVEHDLKFQRTILSFFYKIEWIIDSILLYLEYRSLAYQ